MAAPHPQSVQELKRLLVASGLEIYRTRPDAVHLAERPRDNQILDAGISVGFADAARGAESGYELRVVMRCQRSDFPREEVEALFARVRMLAADSLVARGFAEVETREQHMLDPGDATKTLDTWYEIVFVHRVADLDAAVAEAKHALGQDKFVKVG
jgi:hypothetical protein